MMTADRLLRHIGFLADMPYGNGRADIEDVYRHFRLPPDDYTSDQVDQLIKSLVVSGFVRRDDRGNLRLTGRKMTESQGHEIDTTGRATFPAPPGHQVIAGVAVSPDGGGGIVISAGPAAEGWHIEQPDSGDVFASFQDEEEIANLAKMLKRALAACRRGQPFDRSVSGTDIADVRAHHGPGHGIFLSVVPWEWRGQDEDYQHDTADLGSGDPYDEIPVDYEDDNGVTVAFTQAERDAMAADALRERAKYQAELDAAHAKDVAARPDLTSRLSCTQVEQLLDILQPRTPDGRLKPVGVVPGA